MTDGCASMSEAPTCDWPAWALAARYLAFAVAKGVHGALDPDKVDEVAGPSVTGVLSVPLLRSPVRLPPARR